MKNKTDRKLIAITATATVLVMLTIFFALVFLVGAPAAKEMSENNDVEINEASKEIVPNIEIYDETNALEGLIDKEFILDRLLPPIEVHFDYTDALVSYNTEDSKLYILLTISDESFGKFIAETIYDENKDGIKEYLYIKLSESRYQISQKSMKSIIDSINDEDGKGAIPLGEIVFEITSESTPDDKILFRVNNDSIDSFIDRY